MSSGSFELDPRLATDSVFVADGPLSQVRLMDDARFPWLLLVPRELHFYTTSDAERRALIDTGGAIDQGIAGYTASNAGAGRAELFRLNKDGLHIYTTSTAERDLLTGTGPNGGWTLEGNVGFIDTAGSAQTSAFYRLFHAASASTIPAPLARSTPGVAMSPVADVPEVMSMAVPISLSRTSCGVRLGSFCSRSAATPAI